MNLFVTSPEWIVWLLVALLAAATIQDGVQLKISNYICGGVLILAVVAMAVSGFRLGLWQNAVVFAAVLVVGMFLFERNVLGGGDVKLFAALGLWVDFGTAVWLVASIAIAGGLLAVTMIFLRSFVPDAVSRRVKTLRPRAGIPYGIAIAVGTLLVVSLSGPPAKQVPYVPVKGLAKTPAQAD